MSGHVFHPGHQELHGITVVLDLEAGGICIGRFDREDESGVHLLNVSRHTAGVDDPSPEAFIRHTARFGVRADEKAVVLPPASVLRIRRLSEFDSAVP